MLLNRELYGDIDSELFGSMMSTEKTCAESFIPTNDRARQVQSELLDYMKQHEFSGLEVPLLSTEEMRRLHEEIINRYGEVLAEVPDTPSDLFYDASQCVEIFNKCLQKSGLAEKGWKCVLDNKRSVPATNTGNKTIFLPSNTHRNADQLRRLYIHEGEVHARRGQNGEETGVVLLKGGTANYTDVEEGAGVVMECILAGNLDNESFQRARDRYIVAGLALGADGTPKDGRATFELTWRMLALRYAKDGAIDVDVESKAKQQALVHDDNAFRGTNFAMPGIIYSKLKVYYEGLAKNAQYLHSNIDNIQQAIDNMMIGKYDHTDPRESQLIMKLTGVSGKALDV